MPFCITVIVSVIVPYVNTALAVLSDDELFASHNKCGLPIPVEASVVYDDGLPDVGAVAPDVLPSPMYTLSQLAVV